MFSLTRLIQRHLENIFYHPVRGRVAYDVLIVLSAGFIIFSLLPSYTLLDSLSISLIFTTILTGIMYILGVYTRLKVSSPLLKSLAILIATIIALEILVLSTIPLPIAIQLAFFSVLLLVLPRYFLSFNRNNSRFGIAYQLTHDQEPILVIGGGGYIGTHLVEQLMDKGEQVRVFDTLYYGEDVLKDLESPQLEVMKGDVTDIYALTKALHNVKAVVHLAGIVGDPACKLDDDLTLHVNLVTTRMVKESVKGLGIPRFVFASSCSVYGAADEVVDEESELNPVSLYAKTKIDSEREILQDTYDLFHPTILRFATVFGHSRRMRFDLVGNLFTAQAYDQGTITVMGGKQWRPFIHVSDVARSIVTVLESPLPKVSRQVFNVGDDRLNTTIDKLASLTKGIVRRNKSGKPVRVMTENLITDNRNYHVSFNKIRRELSFEATVLLPQGIEEMTNHFRANAYKHHFTNRLYSNLEMTKLIQKEFHSAEYRKSHFSLLLHSK